MWNSVQFMNTSPAPVEKWVLGSATKAHKFTISETK